MGDPPQRAAGAGHRTADQEQVTLDVGLHDLEVQRRRLLVSHSTRHFLALEHPRRGGALADGSGLAMDLVGSVRGALALEAVALHDAGKALALADGGDVDVYLFGKRVDVATE